ncbi:hypothetical protein [Crossiella cryophila]|uniref:Uncharacterized protein n=1 Tax=Crossiella cryophila TaxID=43355 RepID=A0A7W7CHG8_9PSEU|nr:hypothetical protein [Crossiella cryophila]MBB4679846.1 hypothetical protein [Crossiella cryophila]
MSTTSRARAGSSWSRTDHITALLCAAAGLLWALAPNPPGAQHYPPTMVPRWLILAAVLCGLTTLLLRHSRFRPGWQRVGAAVTFTLFAVSGGFVFELLGLVAVVPSATDTATVLLRGLAAVSALLFLRATAGRGSQSWWGYAACALPLPYLLLKTYWALGGQHGFMQAGALGSLFGAGLGAWLAGWGTVLAALVAMVIALAQARGWGSRSVRGLLTGVGWFGSLLLVSAGFPGVYGVLLLAFDSTVDSPHFVTGWVLPVVYGNFALWGLALARSTALGGHRGGRPDRADH